MTAFGNLTHTITHKLYTCILFCAILIENGQKLLRFSEIKFIVQLKKSFYNKAYGNQVVMNLYTN